MTGGAELGRASVGPVVDLGDNLRREYVTAGLPDGGTWAVWVYKMHRGGVPTLQPARYATVAVFALEIEAFADDPAALAAHDEHIRAEVVAILDRYDEQHEQHHLRG